MSVSIMITSSDDLEKINLTLKVLNFITALVKEPLSAESPQFNVDDLDDLHTYYSTIQKLLNNSGMTLEDYEQSIASS